MTLHITSNAADWASRAIFLTGVARSGTSILSRVLHSLDGVELAFEPPMLFSLLPTMERMDRDTWRLLYETYLYEEFLVNAVAGRAINTNRSDDSSIHHVKDAAEIAARLDASLGKTGIEGRLDRHHLAIKMPDVIPFLPALQRLYPGMRVVCTRRDPVDTLNSLARKGWFDDAVLRPASVIWPVWREAGGVAPTWVAAQDREDWFAMGPIDRCAYYILRMHDGMTALDGAVFVTYEALLEAPRETARDLAAALGLRFGALTERVVAEVRPMRSPVDASLLDRVRPDLRARLEASR